MNEVRFRSDDCIIGVARLNEQNMQKQKNYAQLVMLYMQQRTERHNRTQLIQAWPIWPTSGLISFGLNAVNLAFQFY